jgi:cytochrome c oxidase subunit 2
MFRPDSSQSERIQELSFIMFGILAFVLVVVWTWLVLAVVRYRRRRESEVKQTRGNLVVEIIWTAIPTVIVAVLFTLTLQTTAALSPSGADTSFVATSHQWWWEFEYPDGDFVTANEVHVPVDTDIIATMLAADVIHSYWVPQMGGKIDMIPGHPNRLEFHPTRTGTFIGQCSEYCGHQHANMRFLLIVQTAGEFSRWFANQQQPAREPTDALTREGAEVMRTQPCAGCHAIRGTDLSSRVGPDLTHFGSRRTLAAGVLANTPTNLRRWLKDPQEVKPQNKMPTVPLTDRQLDALVAYLESLK